MGRHSALILDTPARYIKGGLARVAFFRTGSCTDIPYRFVAKHGEEVDVLLSAISV